MLNLTFFFICHVQSTTNWLNIKVDKFSNISTRGALAQSEYSRHISIDKLQKSPKLWGHQKAIVLLLSLWVEDKGGAIKVYHPLHPSPEFSRNKENQSA